MYCRCRFGKEFKTNINLIFNIMYKIQSLPGSLSDYCQNYIDNIEFPFCNSANYNAEIWELCINYLRGNYVARDKERLTRFFISKLK